MKVARARSGMVGPGMRYGDPGIFSFVGKVAKGIVGGAVGLATGGLSGAITGAVSPFVSRPGTAAAIPQNLPMPSPTGTIVPFPGPGGLQIDPTAVLPGGRKFISRVSTNGEAKPSGYHLNRADYWLKDGTFVPKGSRYVKNRRRNPLNPNALRRAVARIDAGKTWQSKLHEIETGKYTKAGNRKACA